MRQNRVDDVLFYLFVAILLLAPFVCGSGGVIDETLKPCDIHEALEQCGPNERCDQISNNSKAWCVCQLGYMFLKGACRLHTDSKVVTTVQPDLEHDSGGSSVAAGLLIPTFLVVVGVLLYFGARRYKWLEQFRQFRQNRYGNVLVTRDDDDDDDPPIA